MNRILVVNMNWLGDVIFSTPAFKALREKYPGARISCLAVPRVKGVLAAAECVDEVLVYDEKGVHRSPFGKLAVIRALRRGKFDVAFILHRSLTRALLVWLAGIPVRVGYDTKGRGVFLTHRITAPVEKMHRSDEYLNVFESYGIPVRDRKTCLKVSGESRGAIKGILEAEGFSFSGKYVVVNPGGNWNLKRWPEENWAALVAQLAGEGDFKIIISGSKNDKGLAQRITQLSGVASLNLTGLTSLDELMALFEKAELVISADSGPLHLAVSVGASALALFGPTRPETTGPRGQGKAEILQYDVGCNRSACYYLDCPDNVCMKSISVDDVLEKIRQI